MTEPSALTLIFKIFQKVELIDLCIERLICSICSWEDGRGKRVPVSRSQCVCSVSIQFQRVGVLNLRKSCISRK